jgi:GPH family glycoside/pentoside/hexuronide:cation symporter
MTTGTDKLAAGEKLAYGLGDAAANFVFQTQITFLMFFYTDVFGISAGTAGTILLVSRLIDAVNDPMIGALADRTNTRWGHYRPWILWSALPMAILLVLCYTTPPFSSTGKIVWAIITYNALMVIYAANNIPYCALSGVMTGDTSERTSLASWRFVCAMATAMVVNLCTLDLVKVLGQGDAALGYQLTMAIWGALAVVLFLITFAFTRERIALSPKQRSTVWQDIFDLFHNRPWIALFALSVLIYIELSLRSSALLYYFRYYLQLENVFGWIDNFSLFNGMGLAFTIIGVAASKPLVNRFGKRKTFFACLILSASFMAAFAAAPRHSFSILLALQILLQLSFGPTIPILWAMMADVADFGEWQTGRRSTALAFASIVFGLKLGSAFGGILNGELLEYFGYTAGGMLSPRTRTGILMMASIIPAAVLIISACVLYAYRLNDQRVSEIEQSLTARRNHAPVLDGPSA